MALSIRLFGELEAELDGQRIGLPAGRACELLAWLALHPGPQPRPRLAARFWPDAPDSAARASLRSAVWALRTAFGPAGARQLTADRGSVGLCRDGLTVDLDEFRRLVDLGRPADAVGLCRGELLPSFGQDWAVEAREQHAVRLSAALSALAERYRQEEDLPAAIAAVRRQVALLPFDEAAARTLMALLAESGDTPAALEAYARLRRQLAEELDTGVGPETAALARRLRAAARGPTGPGSGRSRLIGRAEETATLTSAWREAAAGRGSVLLLSGDGGMGKTRLVQELGQLAADEGARTLTGYAGGPGGGAPFALWVDPLGLLVDDPTRADPLIDPRAERIRQLERATQALLRAVRAEPLLLVLEDVHRADPSSLELLAYVGRRIAGHLPALLVATCRRMPRRPELDAAVAALRASGSLGREIELGPLPLPTIRRIALCQGNLTEDQAAGIARVADGNPLLAVETAKGVALRGADLPAGLRGAVRAACERLGPGARRLTDYLAAAGRELRPSELAALPLADVRRAAGEALGSGLLAYSEASAGVGFRHALLREACYADLPAPERSTLHADLAEVLAAGAARSAATGTGTARNASRARSAAELGRHLRLSGQDGPAGARFAEAAAAARAVCALPEAAAFLREARELAPDSVEILLDLAEVEAWRGRLPSSDEAFERAVEQLAPSDGPALTRAWLRRGHWLRGGVCHPRESRRSYLSALDLLDRAPQDDPEARAEALAGLAWAQAVAGDPDQVERILRQVAEVTGHRAPGDLLAHDIGSARGHALIRTGRLVQSYGPLVAAAASAGRAGRPDLAYGCMMNAASAAAAAGEWDRALDFADRCLALVVPNGLLRNTVGTHCARASALRRLGRTAEARTACEQARAIAELTGLAELQALVHHDLGLLALATGCPEAAADELELALAPEAPVSRPRTRLLLAEALARSGRPAEAEVQLRAAALEPVAASDFPDTLVARMCHVQGLIAVARGDGALALRRLAESAAAWERRGTGVDGEAVLGALIDLGRPPIGSLVEPALELAAVRTDLAALAAALHSTS
ncbi:MULTISPECIES: AAA family ATPase [Streptacidiphilus]|uniref:AAA family ATPase n=1 Tax=Streptacidiphilus cavernicola TaxID=3342716 RepID=A0ABV6V0Q1_9ACTN|nr:AAA family ATPase [Streptacidiphilus jeojiense]